MMYSSLTAMHVLNIERVDSLFKSVNLWHGQPYRETRVNKHKTHTSKNMHTQKTN